MSFSIDARRAGCAVDVQHVLQRHGSSHLKTWQTGAKNCSPSFLTLFTTNLFARQDYVRGSLTFKNRASASKCIIDALNGALARRLSTKMRLPCALMRSRLACLACLACLPCLACLAFDTPHRNCGRFVLYCVIRVHAPLGYMLCPDL